MRRLRSDWRVWLAAAGVLVAAVVVALIVVIPHGPAGPRGPRGRVVHVTTAQTPGPATRRPAIRSSPRSPSPVTLPAPAPSPPAYRPSPQQTTHRPHRRAPRSPSPAPCPTLPVLHICRPG